MILSWAGFGACAIALATAGVSAVTSKSWRIHEPSLKALADLRLAIKVPGHHDLARTGHRLDSAQRARTACVETEQESRR
jgi:hypothetical protein